MRARSYAAAVLALAALLAGCSVGDGDDRPPQLGTKSGDEDAAAKLGFPSTATKNTIRVGGGDAVADAAGVASAVFPGTSDAGRPTAVVLVDKDDWQAGVTAAALTARPIGAPLLISDGDELPPVSADTLDRLKPKGSDLSKDAQVIRIGDKPARPEGYKTAVIEGKDPYERAAAIDRFFSAAKGKPSTDVVIASGEQARVRDAGRGVGRPFRRLGAAHPQGLGSRRHHARRCASTRSPTSSCSAPRSVISKTVEKELGKLGKVQADPGRQPRGERDRLRPLRGRRLRLGGGGAGLQLHGRRAPRGRSMPRPSAALATKGVFAPLLLTDRADALPRPLETYLLSVQPGFEDDPGQAVYNRVWILGDDKQLSVDAQARLDQITELIPVQANAP